MSLLFPRGRFCHFTQKPWVSCRASQVLHQQAQAVLPEEPVARSAIGKHSTLGRLRPQASVRVGVQFSLVSRKKVQVAPRCSWSGLSG